MPVWHVFLLLRCSLSSESKIIKKLTILEMIQKHFFVLVVERSCFLIYEMHIIRSQANWAEGGWADNSESVKLKISGCLGKPGKGGLYCKKRVEKKDVFTLDRHPALY